MKIHKKYSFGRHIYKIAVGFDQWACAIANGNIDSTISATTGKYQYNSAFWEIMAKIIDWTFWPVDGYGHCRQAYEKDANEDFEEGIKVLMFAFTIIGCLVIAPITYTILLINLIIYKLSGDNSN